MQKVLYMSWQYSAEAKINCVYAIYRATGGSVLQEVARSHGFCSNELSSNTEIIEDFKDINVYYCSSYVMLFDISTMSDEQIKDIAFVVRNTLNKEIEAVKAGALCSDKVIVGSLTAVYHRDELDSIVEAIGVKENK